MARMKFRRNREEARNFLLSTYTSTLVNAFLIFAVILTAIYMILPLLGGKFSAIEPMRYAIWIVMALVLKFWLNRMRKGLRIGAWEHILAWLCSVANFGLWIKYPINVLLSILSIYLFIRSYKAQGGGVRPVS